MGVLRAIGLLTLPALTGHLSWRAFASSREEDSLSEVLFLQILAGVLITGWPAFLLAECGLFSFTRVALLILLFDVVLCVTRWSHIRSWRWPKPRLDRQTWPPLLLLLGAAALFFHPGEWILGGQDPGVYVSIGASIGRTGGIVLQDPAIVTLPAEARPLLLSFEIEQWWQLPGFYVTDFATGEVTPQFLHLYPTWLALFHDAGGLRFALLATPLFTWLGLVAFYLLARRLFGEWPALVAVALLALNPGQIWFAREPGAESLTILLLLGGWYLLHRAAREPARRDLAVLAGLALGQVTLAKFEFVVLIVLLLAYAGWRLATGRRMNEKAFLLAYIPLVVHTIAHMGLISHPYLRTFLSSLAISRVPGWLLPSLSIALIILVALLYACRKPLSRLLQRLGGGERLLRNGLTALWLLLALYGWVLLPRLAPAQVEIDGQWFTNYDRLGFQRLTWYLSPIGLGLAVLGLSWWLRSSLAGASIPFLLTFLVHLALYTYRALSYPYHFWVTRRYVPLIFPCLTLGIALALWRVRLAPLGRAIRRAGAAFLLVLLLTLSLLADAPFVFRRELAGAVDAVTELAEQVPDDVPLLIANLGPALAAPLRYIEGREAFALSEPVPWEALWRLLQDWPAGEDTTYLLVGGLPPLLHGGFSVVESGPFTLDVVRTEQALDHLPRDTVHVRAFQRLLRVQRRSAAPHALELALDSPAWTSACLVVVLPAPTQPLSLRLEAAGFRPDGLPPARLQVFWDGLLLTEKTLERSWDLREVALLLSPPSQRPTAGGEARLELCVETWNPQEAGYGEDRRDLGILLKSLAVQAEGSP